MTKKDLGTLIATLGWSLGWGLSWALIVSYQRSIAPKSVAFGSLIPEFDLGWYIKISIFFMLGWVITGFSTSLMMWINGKVNIKYGILIGILWGVIGLPTGGILGWLFNNTPGDEFIYFVNQGVFFLILLPIGFGILGFIGILGTLKILKHLASPSSNFIDLTPDITWGTGAAIGSLIGAIIFIIGGGSGSGESAFSSGLATGIVGGLVAGSISNETIYRNLDKQKAEVK